MPWIKFLQQYTVSAAGGPTYKKDQVVEMDGGSARHFVKREVAVGVPKPAKKQKSEVEKKSPTNADKEIEPDRAPTGEDIKDAEFKKEMSNTDTEPKKKAGWKGSAKKAPAK